MRKLFLECYYQVDKKLVIFLGSCEANFDIIFLGKIILENTVVLLENQDAKFAQELLISRNQLAED